jgi:subtilisin family serine protease
MQISPSMIDSITAIVVEPLAMHWSRVLRSPKLQVGKMNRIRLKSYLEQDPRFKTRGTLSWGVERLGLVGRDKVDGRGVKIGLIDTGCDSTHDMLQHVTKGRDFNESGNASSWQIDSVGHGTHCAGIIGARYTKDDFPIRGMAPAAEDLCL